MNWFINIINVLIGLNIDLSIKSWTIIVVECMIALMSILTINSVLSPDHVYD